MDLGPEKKLEDCKKAVLQKKVYDWLGNSVWSNKCTALTDERHENCLVCSHDES